MGLEYEEKTKQFFKTDYDSNYKYIVSTNYGLVWYDELKEEVARLKGEGKTDAYGRKGDLYFIIHFKDNEYTFDGSNLTKDVELTPPEAVLGCSKDIQTLHGKIKIKIPSGVSSGQSLRLKQLGIPTSNGYSDLNARIKIVVPKNQSKEVMDLYKKILSLQ